MDKRLSIHWYGWAILLLLGLRLPAQTVANASINPDIVETGDTFSLRLLVSGTEVEPVQVQFSNWDSLFPADNILSQSAWRRSGTQWVKQYTLIAFDSAVLDLPPLAVRLHLGDSVLTNPIHLTVNPTPATADLGDMDPIRDIRREPVTWLDYWPWALLVFTLILAVIWYRRRLRERPPPPPVSMEPPPAPAHVVALQQLEKLHRQKKWQHGKIEAHYAELSLIVREYLEKRYGILALESTTREILQDLKPTDFPLAMRQRLDNVLTKADLVKFANASQPKETHEKTIQDAKDIVHATQPKS